MLHVAYQRPRPNPLVKDLQAAGRIRYTIRPLQLSRGLLHSGPEREARPDLRSQGQSNQTQPCSCLSASQSCESPAQTQIQRAGETLSSAGANAEPRGSRYQPSQAAPALGFTAGQQMVWLLQLPFSSPPKQGGPHIVYTCFFTTTSVIHTVVKRVGRLLAVNRLQQHLLSLKFCLVTLSWDVWCDVC